MTQIPNLFSPFSKAARHELAECGVRGIFKFRIWILLFDLAQGGESFDFAQDREPVERLVEPFGICVLLFGNFLIAETFIFLQHVVR